MKFGIVPLASADGAILAHTLRAGGTVLKKGRRLGARELVILAAAGIEEVMAARLEPDDVPEDAVAHAVATALAGEGVRVAPPKTGRANLFAAAHGLWHLDSKRIHELNEIDEAITVATLADGARVNAQEMVATVKVIPFAVPRLTMQRCLVAARQEGQEAATRVAPFSPMRVGLLLTQLAGQPSARLEQGTRALTERVNRLGSRVVSEVTCKHDIPAVAQALADLAARDVDCVLLLGASAIVDRRDVIPAAIELSGGTVHRFGMPVDPGNLILVASRATQTGICSLIGVPSCARSPKRSGFDMVLERLAAGASVEALEVPRLGVGGLLPEIASRPAARDVTLAIDAAPDPRVGALVLAAGSSRRMGSVNKLLVPIDGIPMVTRVVDRVQTVVPEVTVVTGHQSGEVVAVLEGRDLRQVHNAEHEQGLASSLKAGIADLPKALDGVLVCLGDMPWVKSETMAALVDAFDPAGGAAICVPVHQGKRGNPVLWGRRYFEEILALSGDVGARELLARHDDEVVAVAVDDPSILWDVDTEEALRERKSST